MSENLLEYGDYGLDYWKKNVERDIYLKDQAIKKSPFSYYYNRSKVMLEHVYFIRGLFGGAALMLFLVVIFKTLSFARKKK